CDADPSALANYVVALVKKDKPEKELKAFCADQLDVFLQKETSGFVDKLFESLYTKNYLPPLEPVKPEPKPPVQEKEEIKEEVFQEPAEEERDGRKKKYPSPQKARSESSERRTREKKREDGKWRDYDRYYERNELYREKYDWRRGRSKSRSKSRGLSRSRSRSRGRSKDQDPNRNVGPPITQSSLINNRDQPGTSAVPNLAPVGARLPPPLPQNLLYTVSERQPMYSREHGAAASERLQLGTPPPLLAARLVPPRNLMGSSIGYHTSVSSPTPLVPDTYEPDGYNPEAPSITSSGRSQYRQFFSRTQTQRPNLIGLTSGDMDANPRAANIVIQTEPPVPVSINSNITRVVLEPDSRKRAMSGLEGPLTKKPWLGKQGNNNQSKPGFLRKNQYTNTKLEVKKIPQELNNITKLNEHFSKFGTIVNIQVAFKGDPEAALIQYLTNEEARKAISSTEAVLNNRFIRVLWHRENNEQPALQSPTQLLLQQQQTLGHLSQQHHHLPQHLHQQQVLVAQSPPSTVHGGMQKEAMKLQQDMRKKRQEMLEKQIECQKAQKELLDTELDLHKRLSSGEDTTELRKKLNQLQVEAARLGILPVGRGKTMSSQGRGRGRGRGGRGRGSLNHMVVDHRPKALTVGGFIEEEKDELLQHFSETETSDLFLHDDDDEDEDEYESRSWRR
ncbi:hypothetical protein CB1_000597005, partial [Camelus ferus]